MTMTPVETPVDLPQGITQNTISFLIGHPDPAALLTPELQSATSAALTDPRALAALQYGPEQGTPALIQFLLEKLQQDHVSAASTIRRERIMIVAGSTHAVDMLTRLYARPNGMVLVETPTYADSLHIFRDHQVELHGLPMDEQGLLIEPLADKLAVLARDGKTPAFLYTIPNYHNPTGITASEARRLEVIRLARQYGFPIVEDDVYRDLTFEAQPPATYYALADGQNVFSIGSFSKTLAPGLRLGWLLAPEDTIIRCVKCGTTQMGGGASPLSANIVAEYCRHGHWDGHVTRLRQVYGERCNAVLTALEKHMPPGVSWTRPGGGFFIWVTLPQDIQGQAVKQAALKLGVLVAAGNGYFIHPEEGDHYLRLAFSFARPADIDMGIARLARAIAEVAALGSASLIKG